ncbi:hypothetical protein Q8F55_006083 [Vanrija albida]|uniref:BTB domain-containing protein n=1 Tax=Vanrija albida TaxID=181172 RepID=A0ABR3Q3N2_9TREE
MSTTEANHLGVYLASCATLTPVPTTTVDGLDFHADFSLPASATLFQSADGVYFRFQLALLAAFSPFFADLATLPTATTGAHEAIPLPSATAPALAVALHLIAGQLSPRAKMAVKWPDEATIEALVDVINAYDLPIVRELLVLRCRDATTDNPFEWLVLEACTQSPDTELGMKAAVFCDLNNEKVFTPWAKGMLDRLGNPGWHLELLQVHLDWSHRYREFLVDHVLDEDTVCLGTKDRDYFNAGKIVRLTEYFRP